MSDLIPIARSCWKIGAVRVANHLSNRFEQKKLLGNFGFPFVVLRKQRPVQILLYHRVNDDLDWSFPGTPTSLFAKQMEYLAETHQVLDLADAAKRLAANDVPDNAIVITFDDGYQDNFLNAFPVLKKLSLPATVFLAIDAIGTGRLLWHDRVFNAFRETQAAYLPEFPEKQCYPLGTVLEKAQAQDSVLKFVFSLGEKERDTWIDRLVAKLQVPCRRSQAGLMLSWDQVASMHQNGVAFGSHTMTHPITTRLPVNRMCEEIVESKKTLEARLGTAITTFAYPKGGVGDFDATTRGLLIEAGYHCAVTTLFGVNKPGQDLYELKRGTPWEQDVDSFALKLAWYRFAAA